jgi:hypothetical protein
MSHWAELNEKNEVIRITVGDNNDPNGDEGYQWLLDNLGGTWIKCSYNGTIRHKYPALGDSYSEEHDAFIDPQPFESWIFNTSTLNWDSPVPIPDDGKAYGWNEDDQSWVELDRTNVEGI